MSQNPYQSPGADSNDSLIRRRTDDIDIELATSRFYQFRRGLVFTGSIQIVLFIWSLGSERPTGALLIIVATIAFWTWAFLAIIRRLERLETSDIVIAACGFLPIIIIATVAWLVGDTAIWFRG